MNLLAEMKLTFEVSKMIEKFRPVSWMSLDQVHLLQKPASNLLNKSLQKVQWKTTRYLVSWLILTSNWILKKYNNNTAFIKLFPNKNTDKNNSNN